MVCLTEFV